MSEIVLMAWNNSPLGENGEFLVSMVLMEALTTFWDVKVAKGSQNNWYFGCYNQKREKMDTTSSVLVR